MANVKKANRVQDTDIKRLNHVGLGLKAIAELLGCHPATVTLRLKALSIEPVDTRRSFMERVFLSLTPAEQDWLSHNLFNSGIGVGEFVIGLIKEAFANAPAVIPAPVAMPAMQTPVAELTSTEKNQEGAQQVHENLVVAAEKTQETAVVAVDTAQPGADKTVVAVVNATATPVQVTEIPQVPAEHVEDSLPASEPVPEKPQSLFK